MRRFEFAHVAEGIARQAGALLRGFYDKGVATEYKGDVDLVTEADRASEALIRERLSGGVSRARDLRRGGNARPDGERVPLVRGPAGRDDELRARVSGVLRGAGAGAEKARAGPCARAG